MRWIATLYKQRPPQHLLVACFPKSGSTYLSRILQEITGLGPAYVSEAGPQNEQDLSRKKLVRLRRRSVLQQHVKATVTNLQLIREIGMRPIVLTRSLFDVLISLHDYYERDRLNLPCGYVTEEYLRSSLAERLDYLIHLHLPWYFNFLTSWREAAHQVETLRVRYEDLFADQLDELRRIAEFYELPVSTAELADAIGRLQGRDTRFNVGVVGRGTRILSDSQKHTIRKVARLCHLDIDDTGNVVDAPRARCVAA